MNKVYYEALFFHDIKMFLGEEFLLEDAFYDLLNGFYDNYKDKYIEEFNLITTKDPKKMFECLILMENDYELVKILDEIGALNMLKIGNLATLFVEYIYKIYDYRYVRYKS